MKKKNENQEGNQKENKKNGESGKMKNQDLK